MDQQDTVDVTMVQIWDELTDEEKRGVALMCNTDTGVLALTKISKVLKSIYYKHGSPFPNQPYYQAAQQLAQQASHVSGMITQQYAASHTHQATNRGIQPYSSGNSSSFMNSLARAIGIK